MATGNVCDHQLLNVTQPHMLHSITSWTEQEIESVWFPQVLFVACQHTSCIVLFHALYSSMPIK